MALVVKNPPANARDIRDRGLIAGSGRSPGGGMATHSSILAWRIPWSEEPGGLWSIGSQRGRHWSDLACMQELGFKLINSNASCWFLFFVKYLLVRELMSVTEKRVTWYGVCVCVCVFRFKVSGALFQYSEPGKHPGFRLYLRNVTSTQYTFIEGLALG